LNRAAGKARLELEHFRTSNISYLSRSWINDKEVLLVHKLYLLPPFL
jgi:hypothetical protein